MVCKPTTDLCATYQKNNAAIICSSNMAEEDKPQVSVESVQMCDIHVNTMQTIKEADAHLLSAMCERSFYRTAVKKCCDLVQERFIIDGTLCLPAPGSAPASGSGSDSAHYSFDFAQQVHYPHNPLQPGPMYFKTVRKCTVFGVCCEGIPHQFIDEACDTGKGANTVVSLLHHLENHSLGEVNLHHADNCVGQNKNNVVLQVNISAAC